jgi:hypothetical protein
MDEVLGTCSVCGGAVTVPRAWMGMLPPIPQCRSCGATKKQPNGPVIEMEPRPRHPVRVTTSGFIKDLDVTF